MARTGKMTPKEGWRDLRRRLPGMNRKYQRQRAIRWAVIASCGIGIVLLAIITFWSSFPSAPIRAESNLPTTRAESNQSTSTNTGEAAPDSMSGHEFKRNSDQ